MPALTFRLKNTKPVHTTSENLEKITPRPLSSETMSDLTTSITSPKAIDVVHSSTNHVEHTSLQETMSLLAPIISFIDLDEDYPEADFRKYKKKQETSKRQGEPLKSKLDKRAQTESLTGDTAFAVP